MSLHSVRPSRRAEVPLAISEVTSYFWFYQVLVPYIVASSLLPNILLEGLPSLIKGLGFMDLVRGFRACNVLVLAASWGCEGSVYLGVLRSRASARFRASGLTPLQSEPSALNPKPPGSGALGWMASGG